MSHAQTITPGAFIPAGTFRTPRKRPETREAWLNALAELMRPMFAAAGAPLPPSFRLTMSLTSTKKAVGTCYDQTASGDRHFEILIRLDQDDSLKVAAIVAHELVHAAVGIEHRHKGRFRTVALAIGLVGKMTATEAGPDLVARVEPMIAELGPLPHARLDYSRSTGPKKQGTRMLKVICAAVGDVDEPGDPGEACGFTVRQTMKWVDSHGPAHCPVHGGEAMTMPDLETPEGEGEGE